MAPWQLQNSFYLLLNSEIDAICSYWLKDLGMYEVLNTGAPTAAVSTPMGASELKLIKQLDKEHSKKILLFSKEYLLDKLELNV